MIDLEQFRETARRAYYWTSFFPEKNGDYDLRQLQARLEEVRSDIETSLLEDEKQESLYCWYETNLIELQRDVWHAKSRCLSSAVTGSAKFPVREAEKALKSAMNKEALLLEHWNRDISKLIEKNLPEKIKQQNANTQDIKAIDDYIANHLNKAHCGTKPLLQGKIERLINRKKLASAEYAINKCKEHKIFTERNRVFKLFEEAKAKAALPEEVKTTSEYEINGVKVRENQEADRFQILFDGKPEQSIIDLLKSRGWRWSPFYKAWQRKLTSNSIYSAKYILENNNA